MVWRSGTRIWRPTWSPGQSWDWVDDNADPSPGLGDDHGTACAGVAAARGFNGIGVSGSAPDAGLVGYRMLDADSDAVEAAALTRGQDVVDIDSCSWGPVDDRHLGGPRPSDPGGSGRRRAERPPRLGDHLRVGGRQRPAVSRQLQLRRLRKLALHDRRRGIDQLRPAVLLLGARRQLTVTAPSNGGSLGITTTDRMGGAGYSSGNYTHSFGGTSAAAPLVAGVAALVLQANPDLTWQDVKQILMETAVKNDPSDLDWTTNGAGYHVNHKYGFGRVDAQAAVDAAQSWVPAGPEVSDEGSATPNLAIPDANVNGVSSTITLSSAVRIEWVDVYFTATHPVWQDLQVVLTSPEGTQSVLADASTSAGAASNYDDWRFGVARCLGEDSQGTWTLTVRDLQAGDTGTFDAWSVKAYGTALGSDATPPTTTVSGADHLWHRHSVTLHFTATDNAGGSGVARTLYTIDAGPWQTLVGSTLVIPAPADHRNDGRHTVSYRSTDNAGNSEVVKSCTVKIDTRGPQTLAPRPCIVRRGFWPALSYRADDLLSPKAEITIRISDARGHTRHLIALGWQRTNQTHMTGMLVWRCRLPRGSYRYTVLARDLAGNKQSKVGSNRLIVE